MGSDRTYLFKIAKSSSKSGHYSTLMRDECKKHVMKPVCDYPGYCRNDAAAVYLGQYQHLAYRPYRNIVSWQPKGFTAIRDKLGC